MADIKELYREETVSQDESLRQHRKALLLSVCFTLLLFSATALTAAEMAFCTAGVIPAVAVWSAGAASALVSLAGLVLCSCALLGSGRGLRPALILEIVAAGMTGAQFILGIVALCL